MRTATCVSRVHQRFRFDPTAACVGYAESATAQQATNLSESCDLQGAQWNSSFDYHYDWCAHGENLKHTAAERLARAHAIAQCGVRKTICTAYGARRARSARLERSTPPGGPAPWVC